MRNFIVTIDGKQYEVGVEEVGVASAPAAPAPQIAAQPAPSAPAAPKSESRLQVVPSPSHHRTHRLHLCSHTQPLRSVFCKHTGLLSLRPCFQSVFAGPNRRLPISSGRQVLVFFQLAFVHIHHAWCVLWAHFRHATQAPERWETRCQRVMHAPTRPSRAVACHTQETSSVRGSSDRRPRFPGRHIIIRCLPAGSVTHTVRPPFPHHAFYVVRVPLSLLPLSRLPLSILPAHWYMHVGVHPSRHPSLRLLAKTNRP